MSYDGQDISDDEALQLLFTLGTLRLRQFIDGEMLKTNDLESLNALGNQILNICNGLKSELVFLALTDVLILVFQSITKKYSMNMN